MFPYLSLEFAHYNSKLRKPAFDPSDVIRQPCTLITGASQ